MAKDKKDKKAPAAEPARAREAARHSAKETPRLKSRFRQEIAPVLMKEFDFKNPMAVPHLHKIVVNMGVGEATQNAKVLDPASNELGLITGQKPVITRAKKSSPAAASGNAVPGVEIESANHLGIESLSQERIWQLQQNE